jgi:hypothetical protein
MRFSYGFVRRIVSRSVGLFAWSLAWKLRDGLYMISGLLDLLLV